MFELFYMLLAGAAAGLAVAGLVLTIAAVYESCIQPLFAQHHSVVQLDAISFKDLKTCVDCAIASAGNKEKRNMYRSVLDALSSNVDIDDSTIIAMGIDHDYNRVVYDTITGEDSTDFSSCIQRYDRFGGESAERIAIKRSRAKTKMANVIDKIM